MKTDFKYPFFAKRSHRLRIAALLLQLFMFSFSSLAQPVNSFDGIVLQVSPTNVNTVYYGEPYRVFFKFYNEKSSPNYYHKPASQVNIKFNLKNLATGKLMPKEELYTSAAEGTRERMRNSKPEKPFEANEYGYYSVFINDSFGTEKLTEESLKYNLLVNYLKALPVGGYELIFEYQLFPGDQVLKTSYKFKVLPVPAEEQAAFRQYIKATVYACKSHFYSGRNYSSSNPDSYDDFVKHYPKSVYTNHAYLNMIVDVYGYANAGPSEEDRVARFNEFLDYYPKLKNNNLKMVYASHLPRFIKLIPGKDVKKELDNFLLLKLKNESPEISNKLIKVSSSHHKIHNLKNYAKGGDNR